MPATFGYVLNVYDTEINFIKSLVNYLTELDSKITCSNNPDDEFDPSKWDEGTDHVPEFNFSIDGEYFFTLKRGYIEYGVYGSPLSSIAKSYIVSNATTVQQINMTHQNAGGGWNYTDINTRIFTISDIVNDNFVLLSIGGTTLSNANYNCRFTFNSIYAKGSSKKYSSIYALSDVAFEKNTLFNISARTFSPIGEDIDGTFTSRFSYACPPGTIDYIKSSVYLNNGQKQFEITSIYDSTTVAIGDTVSLKDGPYLAVGTNQLVKV